MKVRIRYFGRFAMEIGKFSEEIEIRDGATVKELIKMLRNKYPVLKNEEIEVSIDGKYAQEDMPIAHEVSVYPMISGG
ncbi:molybdopterin converting factor, small subunit [Aciduliprofundum sp. MAR08-339]|uniref:MoaD/ThiS family protein n=1 Tax=Aciduliprofundum sp. (strain MAR08-339) TaxID=673860 RepID=UPI0002A4A6EA|nr:molybdopterin converting factor, small subunit [Aciduliprofundum sp. MAR08-339]